ncbi:MAG TPA: ABC transporter ATP-binding protein [Acidimicrobiales bacterium]
MPDAGTPTRRRRRYGDAAKPDGAVDVDGGVDAGVDVDGDVHDGVDGDGGAPEEAAAPRPSGGGASGPVLLDVRELKAGYGSLPVLHGVSFSVRQGETAVILGLNGAGKSTTVQNLCGARTPWEGRVEFEGKDVTRWSAQEAVKSGVVLVPEGRRVFPTLSVERNLLVGSWSQRSKKGWFEQQRERVFDYLPRLRERRNQDAGTLSGGEQQMLAIGRGLMANPKLLIIDEASLGLAPVIVKEIFRIVNELNDVGITVILVEQNIGALEVADLALVLQKGVVEAEVRGDDLRDSTRLREMLLG